MQIENLSQNDIEDAIHLSKTYHRISDFFVQELFRAKQLHGDQPFNSYHEGYGVLLEEVDEVWDEVRKKKPDKDALRKELIQVGAMCIRFY